MDALKPFARLTRCPACEAPWGWLWVNYCPGGRECPDEREAGHLHKGCARCGYQWSEQLPRAAD